MDRDVLCEMPREDRIRHIQRDWFILYPRAKSILDKLSVLLEYPDNVRPPSFMIIGDPNNGKTSIANYFLKKHTPYEEPDGIKIPVIMVEAPAKPRFELLLGDLLLKMGVPFRHSESEGAKLEKLFYYMRELEVKLIIVDEIHNVLSGTVLKQREFMNSLKRVVNESKRPLVLIGTKDALHAASTDYQIQSRFRPEFLPLWKFDSEFLSLLYTIQESLPLKNKSNLLEEKLARTLYDYSEGILGELISLIKDLAISAIQSGKEKIDLRLMKEINWVPPSKRREIPIS